VTPICGRDYRVLERHGAVVRESLSSGQDCSLPSARGICWNPLTRSLLVCDVVKSCVNSYGASFSPDPTGEIKMMLNPNEHVAVIGSRGSAPGQFIHPVAVAVNLRGEIAVADGKLNRVQVFSGSGDLEHLFGRPGTARGEFRGISDVKFTPRGYIAIVDCGNHRVQVMTATGTVVQIFGCYGWKLGEMVNPCALAVSGKGEFFVCDEGNKRIQRFSDRGNALLEWGSRRGSTPNLSTMEETGMDITELRPAVYSIFDAPCDVATGVHGEVIVCDSGRHELLIFSDVGACLHVVNAPHVFQSSSPSAITICSNMLVAVGKSLVARSISTRQENEDAETRGGYNCLLAAFPAEKRVRVGTFELAPEHCAVSIVCFLTYEDALHMRLVNRSFHELCRRLRTQWKLYPLVPGHATVSKYNRVVSPATGLAAVEEAFHKWGLRIHKPLLRIRKHVMDFNSGFSNALSTLYGSLFCYQHEELLRAFFQSFAAASGDKEEIGKAAFIEIVTQIEEVRLGYRSWGQCTAFTRSTPASQRRVLPASRTVDAVPGAHGGVPLPNSLQLVENAQQHQLTKLLDKFLAL